MKDIFKMIIALVTFQWLFGESRGCATLFGLLLLLICIIVVCYL